MDEGGEMSKSVWSYLDPLSEVVIGLTLVLSSRRGWRKKNWRTSKICFKATGDRAPETNRCVQRFSQAALHQVWAMGYTF
jgi:hypothetical protein